MNNDVCDEVVLPKMLTHFLDQHHDACFIKDLDSSFIYANLSAAQKAGLHSPTELLYKREDDLQSKLMKNKNLIKEWQWQDKLVISSRKKLSTLEINPEAVDLPYLVKKYPLYNERNRCVGILIYCRTLETFTSSQFINGQHSGSFLLNKPDDIFTEQECEVLFLKLHGQTQNNIANQLLISPRTVERSVQTLYRKAGVTHFDDFSEFCHQKNYHRYLPRRFLGSKQIVFDENSSRNR